MICSAKAVSGLFLLFIFLENVAVILRNRLRCLITDDEKENRVELECLVSMLVVFFNVHVFMYRLFYKTA